MNKALPAQDGLDILRAMRSGVDYYHVIKVREFRLKVRALSISEKINIMTELQENLETADPKLRTKLNEEIEIAKRTIILASTSDIDKNDPKITDYILSRMTSGEILALYKDYVSWEEIISPDMEEMPMEKIMGYVEALKKNPGLMRELSRLECQSIARFLINQSESLTDKYSIGLST